jgi:hypothetical protein
VVLAMSRPSFATLTLTVALALAATACEGYSDLPLSQRESAELAIETYALIPGASGRLQLAVALPADAVGPVVVVGPPVASTTALRVDGFSVGPCPGQPAPADGGLRLCVAATLAAGPALASPPELGLVVEARGSARRFNVSGPVVRQ